MPEDEPKGLRDRIHDVMEGNYMQAFTTWVTIFALYGDDLRLYSSHKDSDPAWYALYFICLVVFAAELTINCVIHQEYKNSFFFWLDLVATLSLIPDIPWIVQPMYALYGGDESTNSGNASMARAGRAARAGTRAGRIIRLVRLVKLVNLDNIKKMLGIQDKTDLDAELAESPDENATPKDAVEGEKKMEASRLGKILSEQTTRRVIVGVLVMLFSLPQLDVAKDNQTPLFGLEQLFWFGQSACSNVTRFRDASQENAGDLKCDQNVSWVSQEGWDFMVYEYSEQSRYSPTKFQKGFVMPQPLLYLEIPHVQYKGRIAPVTSVKTKRCTKPEEVQMEFSVPEGGLPEQNRGLCEGAASRGECCWQHVPLCEPDSNECPWRNSEMTTFTYTPPSCSDGTSACAGVSVRATFLKRQQSETEAANSMLTTTFIVFLLGVGAMVFSTDTQNLVIAPIEKMVMIVKQLADDPLAKPEVEEEADLAGEAPPPKKRDGQIETSMLENTILKIGALLQVGFGQAGAPIIGKNMLLGGGELQIMVPGRKMFALFGYCDIRDFMETTECLQEEVMVFVNKIARVVHTCVHEWSGAVSKNIGESFLLTWTNEEIDQYASVLSDELGTRDGSEPTEAIGELADKALVSFIKVIAEVRRASDLAAYARHPKIIPKFGMDYKVGMGFTLHCGWAIEAAIGSSYKVDATYLSPHATFCAKLQDATLEYGVEVLVTESVHGYLSNRARDRCRKIDVVKVQEFEKPMGLFTFDTNNAVVTAPDGHTIGQMIPPPEITAESLQARGIDWMFVMDQDIVQLQEGMSLEFQSAWRQAFQWYTNGSWSRSIEALQRCCTILQSEDGPCGTLARYISSLELQPPEDWQGYRVLELDSHHSLMM